MRVKTKIRAGDGHGTLTTNHNATVRSAKRAKPCSLKVKTKVRAGDGGGAGALTSNHNVTVLRAVTAR